jgi:hypothetical protein
LVAVVLLLAISGSAYATFHLWFINQLYSNADGTVQYVELMAFSSDQQFIAGHTITSTQGAASHSFTFATNLPGNTATSTGFKSMLIGTQGFAALGIVTPDYVVPNGFLFTTNGRVNYAEGSDSLSYAALPADGSLALNRGGSTGVNSPMNFAGQSGMVTAAQSSYEGLWLKSDESGWGLNLTHQGTILFATWFTYDTDGSGMWLVASSVAQTSSGNFSGTLYRTAGPAFNSVPFTSLVFPANYTQVGTLTLSFTDANTGTMSYTVNGVAQSKAITRYIYAVGGTNCTLLGTQGASPNYQDLWLNSPVNSEAGWGVNLTHQGDILFATWFTYQAGGKGQWLVMSNGNKTAPGVYTGGLQRTTGPAFSAVPFNPDGVTRTTVGSATFTFSDANNGTFAYTVDGISQTKPITRYIYSTPTTVCQ